MTSPAFSTTRQATAFALSLLVCLLAPLAVRQSWLPANDQPYSSIPWNQGAFAYFDDQIFKEKTPIDILFIGSSIIWWGVDTPQVQTKLSERLGRQAVVRTFGWGVSGLDRLYFVLHDLLQHRKVRLVVFPNCIDQAGMTAHPFAPALFRWPERLQAMTGLTPYAKLSFYCSAILGMPRNLLGMLRSNLPVIPLARISWPNYPDLSSPFLHLGLLPMTLRANLPFVDYTPQSAAAPSDVCVYSDTNKQNFRFENVPVPLTQVAFARRIGALAKDNQVKMVYLHMTKLTEINSPTIDEQTYWPSLFNADVAMMGIPAPKLFAGLKLEDVQKLFYNSEHFDRNGEEYFTSIIFPRLMEIYSAQTNR